MSTQFSISATNIDVARFDDRSNIPLTEILRTHDAIHSTISIPTYYAIASIIDMHVLTHVSEFSERIRDEHDGKTLIRYFAFMGPDLTGENRVFYTINAFSSLHAKYVCIQDCAREALKSHSTPYTYSITDFLRDFYTRDVRLNNVMDHFRAFDLFPYDIVNTDNMEIAAANLFLVKTAVGKVTD